MKLRIFPKTSLRFQLMILFSLTVIIITGFFFVYTLKNDTEIFGNQFNEKINSTLEHISLGLTYGLLEDNWDMTQDIKNWASKQKEVAFFVLFDYEKELVLIMSNKEEIKSLTYEQASKFLNENTLKDEYIVRKIALKTKLGDSELFIGYLTDEYRTQIKKTTINITIISLIMVLFGLFLSYWIANSNIGPLVRLSNIAKRIAQGENENLADDFSGGKEVKDLSISFNQMVRKILNTNSDLKKSNENLEQEIIERKNTEEILTQSELKLRSSEARLKAIVDNAGIGIGVLNKDLNYIQVNSRWSEMFGYDISEINQIDKFKTIHPDYIDASKEKIQSILTGKVDKYRMERRFIRKEGDAFWGIISVSAIPGKDHQVEFIVEMILEITEQKRIENELQRAKEGAESANRTKSEFLANMSHEIRTPMNAILGFAEILSNKISDPEFKNYLNIILSSGNTLLSIINDILDLSKIEAGKLELKPSFNDVRTIINEMKQLFSQKILDKGLNFILEIDDNFPNAVFLDEVRIRQIILNLVSNAIKFTEKGYVKINASATYSNNKTDNAEIVIKVEDTGIGIPEKQTKKIFEPFEQVDGQSTRKFGGTGLGLAISTKLIEKMNGEITVNSIVGKGTIFTVVLPEIPVKGSDSQLSELTDKKEIDTIFKPARILVVDDVETNRVLVKAYLEGCGLQIDEAENGMVAEEKIAKHQFDLLLLDVKMPGLSGEDLALNLKSNVQTRNIPIIMLTASALKEEEERILKYADAFLAKPIKKFILFKELKKFLPFDEKDKEVISDTILEIPVDAVLNSDQKIAFISVLDNYNKEWIKVNKTKTNSIIKDFTGKLKKTGLEYNYSNLIKYSDELSESVNLYRVMKIKKMLSEFPAMIESIKQKLI